MFTISTLGSNGRFGNQLFQYCFAKSLAEKYNQTLFIPENWEGRLIFDIDDPVIEDNIDKLPPKTNIDYIPDTGNKDYDLFGYYQFDEAIEHYNLNDVKRWLKFKDEIVDNFYKIELPSFYTAIHLRRDDYLNLTDLYATISFESFIKAIQEYEIPTDKLLVVSDDMRYQPINPFRNSPISYLHDFYVLMNSSYLLRSNSTFSWWAAILGDVPYVYSPNVQGKTGINVDVKFDKGNHNPFFDTDIVKTRHSKLEL